MRIEEHAIDLITRLEPTLRRTPEGNPGYVLYDVDDGGKPVRWVEVESMTGSLEDRPVGHSRTQFDCARQRGTGPGTGYTWSSTRPTPRRLGRS